ncbi:MAG: sugar ABC transporter permease [Tyzzerella sp.]|nr:sugar ABC transporter permease [Tyzzerella sp.]
MKKKKRNLKLQLQLFAFLLPGLLVTLIFHYIPMYGVSIAFKDVHIGQSLWEGTWVGFKHFERLFNSELFTIILKNTLIVTFVNNFLLWPLPILFALLVHNSTSNKIRKFSQTTTYLPHLISTVVVINIISLFVNGETGLINIIREQFGMDGIQFLGEEQYFRPIYWISEIWQTLGSNAVIYIAALSSVDTQLEEAAMMDGASKIQRMWYIDIPAIKPTIVVMLIMNMGKMLTLGYEKILLMQNDLNLGVSEILGTYIYKTGLVGGQYSFAAAVNLFQNLIGLVLVVVTNRIAKKVSDISLY